LYASAAPSVIVDGAVEAGAGASVAVIEGIGCVLAPVVGSKIACVEAAAPPVVGPVVASVDVAAIGWVADFKAPGCFWYHCATSICHPRMTAIEISIVTTRRLVSINQRSLQGWGL
jgi:hypothetical protein